MTTGNFGKLRHILRDLQGYKLEEVGVHAQGRHREGSSPIVYLANLEALLTPKEKTKASYHLSKD